MCMSALKSVGAATSGLIGGIPGLVGAMGQKPKKTTNNFYGAPPQEQGVTATGPSPSNPYGG